MELDEWPSAEQLDARARENLMVAAECYVLALWSQCAAEMARYKEGAQVEGNPVQMIRCNWTLCRLVADALRADGEKVKDADKNSPEFLERLLKFVLSVIDPDELKRFGVHAEIWLMPRVRMPEYRIYFLSKNHRPVGGLERL